MPDDDLKQAVDRIEHRLEDIDGRLSHIEQDGLSMQVQNHEGRIEANEAAIEKIKPVLKRVADQVQAAITTGRLIAWVLGGALVLLQLVAITVTILD